MEGVKDDLEASHLATVFLLLPLDDNIIALIFGENCPKFFIH